MLSAVGAGVVLAPAASIGQTVTKGTGIIDTHHHIYPPNFTAKNLKRIVADGSPTASSLYAPWTPHFSLDQMDQNGVATAIASISSPGVWFGNNEEGRKWARECNEYGAQLIKDYLGRFGMFAAIPLPDTEGSLREIQYALDVLKLDGIGLLTSYDNGKLLGHPSFAPVFDELNRRKAVIFVHPTMSCCGNPDALVSGPPIDFPTDTTRAITSLVYSGTIARCPDIRFIFSHGGGTTLMLISRLAGGGLKPEERAKIIPNGFEHELQKFYYDIASVAVNPAAMAAVFKVIPMSHLLFGSDIPFWKVETIATAMNKFDISAGDLRGIQRENAIQLLPRLRA
jgi:predicted TIM-barrel fold metal-dependent hydrolase